MEKQRMILGASFLALAGFAAQAGGCSSTSAAPDGGGGATNASSSSGGSGSGSSSSSGGATGGGSDAGCVMPDPSAIIDDMSGAMGTRNKTGGYWYTYSDRTVPYSEPPELFLAADGAAPPGTLTPPEGQSFPVTDSGTVASCPMPLGFRECTGGGETLSGAGFGMDFLSYPPDGGQVPFNECDAVYAGVLVCGQLQDGGQAPPNECDAGMIFNVNDIDSGTFGIVQPFDASMWSGITFYGISFTGASQAIYVSMDDDRTSPWGGICNACVDLGATTFSTSSSGGTKNACSDSFRKAVTFTAMWTQFKIAFSDMTFTPENWSMNGVSAPIHSNKVYNLNFAVTEAPTPAFDLGVALVAFYK